MKTAIAILTALVLSAPACDISEPCELDACEPLELDEETPTPTDEPVAPQAGDPYEAEPHPSCDVDALDGKICDCAGLDLEFRTLAGELVAAGEDPLELDRPGNGIGVAFGICGDTYVWEDGAPSCAVVVAYADRGCLGLTLTDIPARDGQPAVECPYIDHPTACSPG